MFAVGVVVDELHRAGPVKRIECGHIEKHTWLHLAQHLLHAGRLELEDAVGITGRKELVDLWIIEGDRLEVEIRILTLTDGVHRVGDHRERPQTEKVHLEQAQLFDVVLVELRGHVSVGGPRQGNQIDQWFRGDHDPGSVHTTVPRLPLEASCRLHQGTDVIVAIDQFPELRRFHESLCDGDVEVVRYELGDPIHVTEGHSHDPAHVTHCGLGLEDIEGGDLRNRFFSIKLSNVFNDFFTPSLTEIDVDIRHRNPLWIEKPFKEEIVLQGIDIGDAQRVRHHRTRRRSASGAHRDICFFGIPD